MAWTLSSENRTIDFSVPVVGLAAGLSMLVATRQLPVPSHPLPVSSTAELGSLTGIVQDTHGDAIPGAKVEVLGEDGQALDEATSAVQSDGPLALGEFRIDQLPSGTYTLAAIPPGGKDPVRVARVAVSAWSDTRVRVRLDLGY